MGQEKEVVISTRRKGSEETSIYIGALTRDGLPITCLHYRPRPPPERSGPSIFGKRWTSDLCLLRFRLTTRLVRPSPTLGIYWDTFQWTLCPRG